MIAIDTPHGVAHAHLHEPGGEARAALVLGHGAGGGPNAPDLVAATEAAVGQGLGVALIEQPYRVAGRRAPARAPQLDAAFLAIVEHLRETRWGGLPLLVGGRSMGARVACRCAAVADAAGVLCLAFPLVPPRRGKGGEPPASRIDELELPPVPVLVVQGERDPFGVPPSGPTREVVLLAGDHGLKKDIPGVGTAVSRWIDRVLAV